MKKIIPLAGVLLIASVALSVRGQTGANDEAGRIQALELAWNHALDAPGFLNAHSLDLMFTAHPPGNYGYGWFVETQPRRKIYHEGGDPGFAAFELRYPDQKLVIIVLERR